MDNINNILDDYENKSLNKTIKNIDDVDELNKEFNDFLDQQYKKQRDADDVSISLTGMTNQQRYETQMDSLLDESNIFNESKKNKVKRINDKGEPIPETCDKCGTEIKLYFQGEPVWLCSNEKCKKYFGTLPFSHNFGSYFISHGFNSLLFLFFILYHSCNFYFFHHNNI